MQAGKQRGALPLIRKFNEHSERLLKSAMYVWRALTSHPRSEDILTDPWTWRTNGEELIREMLMMCMVFLTFALPGSHLEDLFSRIATTGVLLEMQDRQRYFEARPGAVVSAEQAPRPVRPNRLLFWSRYNSAPIDCKFTCRGATNETRSRRMGPTSFSAQD